MSYGHSDYRIRQGLDRQRQEREEREEREREEQAERERLNAEARARYLAGLDQEKRDRAARHEAEVEASLAGDKVRERRTWLASHPERTAEDFDRWAWPHLRANLLEAQEREALERTQADLRRSGIYDL